MIDDFCTTILGRHKQTNSISQHLNLGEVTYWVTHFEGNKMYFQVF